MKGMKERDDSKRLSRIIQLDDVYWGGERRGGKRGRGSANKVPFVAAVSVSKEGRPMAMNMNVVKGFQAKEIERWATGRLTAGSTVVSNGLACFSSVKKPVVLMSALSLVVDLNAYHLKNSHGLTP